MKKFFNIRIERFQANEYLQITIGVLLVAVGLSLFLIPNKIVAGGVSGIATIIYYLSNLHVGMTMLVLNVVLFLFGFRVLGDGFGIKSIYAVLLLSGSIDLIHNYSPIHALTDNVLLAAIFGNLLAGMGLAMIFNQDASTGGTDILARILNKYTAMDIGRALLIFDFFIAGISGVLLSSMDISLYSMLAVIINTLVIDELIGAFNNRKSMLIISRYPEEILHRILYDLGRGATILNGMGAFERREQRLILTVVSRRQMVKIMKIVKETDPTAFVIIGTVSEVMGEGFNEMQA